MKYTILGFNQKLLTEMGLSLKHAMILRWFIDFSFSGRMSEVVNDGKRYLWIKYQAVIDDLPILEIKNKETISRLFNKMVKSGLLERYIKKINGVYTCYRVNPEKYKTLIKDPTRTTEKSRGDDPKVDTPIDSKVETKDSSININSSIKYNIYGSEKNVRIQKRYYDNLEKDIGFELLKKCIEKLSLEKALHGYKYKRDDLAIRKWVIDAVKKQSPEDLKSKETITERLERISKMEENKLYD